MDPAIEEAQRLIAELRESKEHNKHQVETLLKVTLEHSPDASPDLLYYEAEIQAGPFSHVELREPNPAQERTWLVNLTVRDGLSLPASAFKPSPIDNNASIDIEPRVPPEGVMTYSVREGAQTTYYSFRARSEILVTVSVHRPAD
jgi:hypothetical protein